MTYREKYFELRRLKNKYLTMSAIQTLLMDDGGFSSFYKLLSHFDDEIKNSRTKTIPSSTKARIYGLVVPIKSLIEWLIVGKTLPSTKMYLTDEASSIKATVGKTDRAPLPKDLIELLKLELDKQAQIIPPNRNTTINAGTV